MLYVFLYWLIIKFFYIERNSYFLNNYLSNLIAYIDRGVELI